MTGRKLVSTMQLFAGCGVSAFNGEEAAMAKAITNSLGLEELPVVLNRACIDFSLNWTMTGVRRRIWYFPKK